MNSHRRLGSKYKVALSSVGPMPHEVWGGGVKEMKFFLMMRIIMEELVLGPEVWGLGKGQRKYENLADDLNDFEDYAWSMELSPKEVRDLEKRELLYEVTPLDADPFQIVFEREGDAIRSKYERRKRHWGSRVRVDVEDLEKKIQFMLSVQRFKRRILLDLRSRLLDKYYYTLTPIETESIQTFAQAAYTKLKTEKEAKKNPN
jgi:hypothetical protein